MESAKTEVAKQKNKYLPPSPRFFEERAVEDGSGNVITGISPRCSHKDNGEWVVISGASFFYRFGSEDSFMKDTWVAAAGTSNADARIKMLRWHCFECKNVQEP